MAWEAWDTIKIMKNLVLDIKKQLYERCQQYLQRRIQTAEEAIREAQSSANDETKSSAGDKYETGRAMMQLEIEKNTVQLAETMKLKRSLDQLKYNVSSEVIQPGSLVITDQGNFFIAISVGRLTLGSEVYAVVSPESPIGAMLLGLQKNSSFTFSNKTYTITGVS
jgi:transcription elongation GreA/GreB family factor